MKINDPNFQNEEPLAIFESSFAVINTILCERFQNREGPNEIHLYVMHGRTNGSNLNILRNISRVKDNSGQINYFGH